MDCDHDALCFVVQQHGDPPAFCHKKSLTCWGEAAGLRHLEGTLKARKKSAPKGSYTAKLFADPAFLRNKLLEEAQVTGCRHCHHHHRQSSTSPPRPSPLQELAEATEPDHVAAEAADLIYFAMVRVVAAGADLSMIESHLDLRSLKVTRPPGAREEGADRRRRQGARRDGEGREGAALARAAAAADARGGGRRRGGAHEENLSGGGGLRDGRSTVACACITRSGAGLTYSVTAKFWLGVRDCTTKSRRVRRLCTQGTMAP